MYNTILCSFIVVKTHAHILLIFVFIGLQFNAYAQKSAEGIVFDKETKQRVGRVLLTNTTKGEKIFNNSRGEFHINATVGDIIISTKEGYFSDTLIYQDEPVLIIYLKRSSIYIDPVTVVAKKTADQILNERKRDYKKAFSLADPGSLISVGNTGAGLSIDAVYNYFSREGKNARRLTKYFQKEYENNIIEMRFSRELVRSTTGLEGEALDNFMVRYKPSYEFVIVANHYEMVSYIKSKYEFFKFVPYIRPLPDLNKLNLLPKE